MALRAIEGFAGAGGAALGVQEAGFDAVALIEFDHAACQTLRAAGYGPVIEGDIRKVSGSGFGRLDLMWSSPPCQPWSKARRGAKARGAADERNGWPWHWAFIDRLAADGSQPEWLLAENVAENVESPYWAEVLYEARQRYRAVDFKVLDAADFGAPQRRRRVILACGPAAYPWPQKTHSQAALYRAKWETGSYWKRHGLKPPAGPRPDEARQRHAKADSTLPWRTMRDALGNIRGTPGHYSENSPMQAWRLDTVAPTVMTTEEKGTRAGPASDYTMHGGPDRASDAAWLAVGRRRLEPAECAALQAFPPDYPFWGTKQAQYRQIGNAVPPLLARALCRAIPL